MELKNQKLLIIAPHPDDEVLGCGGFIKRIKEEGGKVYILFMTVGDLEEYSLSGKSTLDERMAEIEKVAKFLRYDDYKISFPGNQSHLKMDMIPQREIIEEIENGERISLDTIQPSIVAVPFISDYNQDHRSTTQALFAASRPGPNDLKPLQKIVLGYESVPTANWWNNPKNSNFFVSLNDSELDAKISALSLYASQVRPPFHPRSLEAMKTLAFYRGMYIGAKAAEAFFSYRFIT